ncbi:MAG: hypothetical protein JWQ73_1779 [Variovorax sp.]|nr:hypothetical protein [Variovorax sp.]
MGQPVCTDCLMRILSVAAAACCLCLLHAYAVPLAGADAARADPPGEGRIWMTVGERRLPITLADNAAARGFAAHLPLTLDMPDLNGNEKHAKLAKALPQAVVKPGTIHAGARILDRRCPCQVRRRLSVSGQRPPLHPQSASAARRRCRPGHDRLTNLSRKVLIALTRHWMDRISFNNGGWIEKPGGEVVSVTTAVGGEFDVSMPPGGWARPNLKKAGAWRAKYTSTLGGMRVNMDLSAVVMEDATLTVAGRQPNVVRIEYRGFSQRFANVGAIEGNPYGPYRAQVWFSPELGRVVRFEVAPRGGSSGGAFHVSKSLDLVGIR